MRRPNLPGRSVHVPRSNALLFYSKDIFEPPWSPAWLQDPFKSASSFACVLFKAPPVAKYSRSQPDRSLKQFRPGVCPDAVDKRLGEISSGRRRASRSPCPPSRPPYLPAHGRREPRTPVGMQADPPSRFSFDSPGILSAYPARLASVVRCILPWDISEGRERKTSKEYFADSPSSRRFFLLRCH